MFRTRLAQINGQPLAPAQPSAQVSDSVSATTRVERPGRYVSPALLPCERARELRVPNHRHRLPTWIDRTAEEWRSALCGKCQWLITLASHGPPHRKPVAFRAIAQAIDSLSACSPAPHQLTPSKRPCGDRIWQLDLGAPVQRATCRPPSDLYWRRKTMHCGPVETHRGALHPSNSVRQKPPQGRVFRRRRRQRTSSAAAIAAMGWSGR